MKINFKEYENMVMQFNLYVNRWIYIIMSGTFFLVVYIVNAINCNEYIITFLVALFFSYLLDVFMKKQLVKRALKANVTDKIVEIQMEIKEDEIVEKVIKENNLETVNVCKYEDITKVREDKFNFYLFITNNTAIIISKQKLENMQEFMGLIDKKCAIIKKRGVKKI